MNYNIENIEKMTYNLANVKSVKNKNNIPLKLKILKNVKI